MPTGHIPILQIKTKDGEWLPVNAIGGQVASKVLYNNAYPTVEQALDYLFENGTGTGGGGTGGASTAENVSYTNTQLPNVKNVKTALDELVPNSHIHANKLALDKLSTDNANSTALYINGKANKIALEPKIFNYASYTSATLNLTNNSYYILRQVHKLTINPPSTPTVAANTIWITFADEGDIELAFPTTVQYIGKIPTVKNGETWEVTIINKVVSIQKVGDGA